MDQKSDRLDLKYSFYIIRDSLIFGILGVILGFVVDLIFPLPNKNDSIVKTTILMFIQIAVSAIIIFFIAEMYTLIFGYNSDKFYGFTMFTVIFFLSQYQLINRLNILYVKLTGKSFE